MEDGGYRRPDLWLSDGWAAVQENGWTAPQYWNLGPDGWSEFTLAGAQPLRLDAPVSHVSYYEAEAFARWADARLPTEAEWETLAAAGPVEGHFVESGTLAPQPATSLADGRPAQMFGDVWEWTASAYLPYPRFRPLEGELGEYNGKFMSGQMVLRGGSCFTPRTHIRATYRNFFPPPRAGRCRACASRAGSSSHPHRDGHSACSTFPGMFVRPPKGGKSYMKTSAILSAAVLSAGVLVSAPGYVVAKDKPVTVVGEIVRYEPGQVIVVRDAANNEVTYTLTPSLTIPTGVEVGRRVTLYTTRGDDGSTTVTRVSTSVTPEGNVKRVVERTHTTAAGETTTHDDHEHQRDSAGLRAREAR